MPRFSENDVDSDIEDAIYARVYFDARDESHQSQIQGDPEILVSDMCSRVRMGEGGGGLDQINTTCPVFNTAHWQGAVFASNAWYVKCTCENLGSSCIVW